MDTPAPPTPGLVQEELARLMGSDVLRRAPTHARLLRYLVDKRVAGDETALREASIAMEVFRRDPSTYDSQTDPIVRVAIGRLRARLAAHYLRYEVPPKLRIVLPKGRYVPEFIAAHGAESPRLGLAVLPTRNQTGEPLLDGCCSDFSDQLADRLARAGLPRVIARGAVDEAVSASREPPALGARLGVAWLLDATLSRESRHELRLTVRLVDTADADVRWVETAVGDDDNVFRLAGRMLDLASLRTLETLPAGEARAAQAQPRTALPAPQRAVLEQARLLLLQRTVTGADAAIALSHAVAGAHPASADAWAMLAGAQYSRMSFKDGDASLILSSLRETLARALALDPGQPLALRTQGILAGKCDHDLEAAESLFLRALRTMPNYTSARLNYAEILTLAGRIDEARAQLSLARLYDPLSPSVHLAHAICLGYQRRWAEAREAWALCRATGETSLWSLTGEGMNELSAGNTEAAAQILEGAARLFPDMPIVTVSLACLHAARGEDGLARDLERECLARFPRYSPAHRAVLAALRRDRAEALRLLEAALVDRDAGLLPAVIEPAFDWLAGDPALLGLRHRCPVWAQRPDAARAA